jgi:predicted nucleic acid-binding protein
VSGIVLDTGALIALERPNRLSLRDLKVARLRGDPVAVPAGCVAQAWRDGSTQSELSRLLRSSATRIEPLDGRAARRVGELLRRSDTSDVVDGHVALLAVLEDRTVFTSDPDDIRRLAPGVRIVAM